MQSNEKRMAILDRLITSAIDAGVAHCRAEDDKATGRMVRIDGRDVLNFSSCSYLGLELDPRVIEGAVAAVRAHGVETSSSRAYLSSGLYLELETLLEQIFGASVVVAPTTTLGHLAALPILVDRTDAIIMDYQVHTSVQVASQFVSASGAHLEAVRHNDLTRLERRVEALAKEHRQVWYMADGVYSMFGDLAPVPEIAAMLDRHPQMRFYVDDAHGMSWAGPRGSGTVMERGPLHPRMVLSTGLAKGFGTGGGVIVLPDDETKQRIRKCGPTLIFGGPMQPPILGAAIESAKIHLTDELSEMQSELRARMKYCHELLAEERLPVLSSPETPVGFIGTGPPKACQAICRSLLDEGIFANPAHFPATPMRKGGTRFLLTRHMDFSDIERLVGGIGRHWEASVRAGGATPEEVWKTFGLEMPEAPLDRIKPAAREVFLERADTIEKLDPDEWDSMLGDRGCLHSSALRSFEQAFADRADPTERWDFRYYVVRDHEGRAVLGTMFTRALWKADMLAPEGVSRKIEAERIQDPLYLTQKVFAMGCLLSEGKHLWLREAADSDTSRQALDLLMKAVRADAQELSCDVRVIRDFAITDTALIRYFEEDGMMQMPAPESFSVPDVQVDEDTLVASLSRTHRYHHRRRIAPYADDFVVEVAGVEGRSLSKSEIEELHALYRNVKARSLTLNTFPLPCDLLATIAESEDWEVVILRPSEDPSGPAAGFFASFVGQAAYVPLYAGLDYHFVENHGLYRQVLRTAFERARIRGQRSVLLGMGAALEKRRMGAVAEESVMLIEADDLYAFDAVERIKPDAASEDAR